MADTSKMFTCLPYDALLTMFYMMVHGFCVTMGVKVTRKGRRDRIDYLAPNVNYVWENYVAGQPEFKNIDVEPEDAHKWVKEQTTNGSIVIGDYFLYIDAFELLHFPNREIINAKKMVTLALQTKFFKQIIINFWSKSGDSNCHIEFTCVPYSLFYQHFWELLHLKKDSGIEVCFNTYNMPFNFIDRSTITEWHGYTRPSYMRDDLTEEGVERAQGQNFRRVGIEPPPEEQAQEVEDEDGWRTPANFQYVSTWPRPISYTPTYDGFLVAEWRLAPVLISLAVPH